MTKKVFISYSRKDLNIMQQVKRSLINAGRMIWTDEGITPGTPNWQIAIEENIREALCVVVLLSPDSASSKWVREELGLARNLGKTIYPIIIRGDETNAVPLGLILTQWVDIRQQQNYQNGIEKLLQTLNQGETKQSAPILQFGPKQTISAKESEKTTLENIDLTVPIYAGSKPFSVAYDGNFLWVTNIGDNLVRKIDPQQGKSVALIEVIEPHGLVWDGIGLWVASWKAESTLFGGKRFSLQQINPAENKIVKKTKMEKLPRTFIWKKPFLWAACDDTLATGFNAVNALQRIDPVRGRVETVAKLDNWCNPRSMVWDRESIWIASGGAHTGCNNKLQRIDPDTGKVILVVEDVGDGPGGLTWDGHNVWLVNIGNNTVQKVDPTDGNVLERIYVGREPSALAWDGTNLWVANREDDTVQKINPKSCEIIETINVGKSPVNLLWKDNILWVVNYEGNSIQGISTKENKFPFNLLSISPPSVFD